MADVFVDPRLPDYFREHAWGELKRSAAARQAAFGDFLQQRIGVLHGVDLSSLDYEFLSKLSFPQTWGFKKLQVRELLTTPGGAVAQTVLSEAFGGDSRAFERFVEQVHALDLVAKKLLDVLLPTPPVVTNLVTRFSETRMENLHYDLDANSDDHEAFRLYINLDRAPRIWATSYQATELIRRGGQRLIQNIDLNAPTETVLKRLATRAFGGWNQRATERVAPRHLAYFDQGDVFFIDGRCVSHQVMSGHRVFTLYAKLAHSSLDRAGPTFSSKIRGALADAANVPIGSETALVSYFQPQQVGAGADLKEDWEHVFGDLHTGRVRRFNDAGLAPVLSSDADGT